MSDGRCTPEDDFEAVNMDGTFPEDDDSDNNSNSDESREEDLSDVRR